MLKKLSNNQIQKKQLRKNKWENIQITDDSTILSIFLVFSGMGNYLVISEHFYNINGIEAIAANVGVILGFSLSIFVLYKIARFILSYINIKEKTFLFKVSLSIALTVYFLLSLISGNVFWQEQESEKSHPFKITRIEQTGKQDPVGVFIEKAKEEFTAGLLKSQLEPEASPKKNPPQINKSDFNNNELQKSVSDIMIILQETISELEKEINKENSLYEEKLTALDLNTVFFDDLPNLKNKNAKIKLLV